MSWDGMLSSMRTTRKVLMKNNVRLLALVWGVGVLLQSGAVGAVFLTGVPDNKTVTSKSNATLGYAFRVGPDPVNILKMGIWDQGANGLVESHEMGIWNTSGELLASVTVPQGTAGALDSNFRYVDVLGGLMLDADTVYVIAAKYYNVDNSDAFFMGSATRSAGIDWDVSRDRFSIESDTFLFPDSTSDGSAYIGPNFEYAIVPVVVPEPDTLFLLVGGAGLLVLLRRRSNKDMKGNHRGGLHR